MAQKRLLSLSPEKEMRKFVTDALKIAISEASVALNHFWSSMKR